MSPADDQPTEAPVTLEEINKQLSELKEAISLLTSASNGSLKEPEKKEKSSRVILIASVIAALASITAAVASFYSGSMTAKTTTALTRATTINAEKAKVDKDAYVRARDDIATLERGFETFLFEKQMDRQNEASKAAADIDQMMNSNSFGSNSTVKDAIQDFYGFINQAISSLQHYPGQWKNADDFRQQAREKQQKALDALDHWLFE